MNVLPRAGRPTMTKAILGDAADAGMVVTGAGEDVARCGPRARRQCRMALRPTPYWEYIRVEPLLSLQTGIASSEAELSNDEVMFIVVHQIDELWFKLVLREMVAVRDLFAHAPVPEQALASAVRGIRR